MLSSSLTSYHDLVISTHIWTLAQTCWPQRVLTALTSPLQPPLDSPSAGPMRWPPLEVYSWLCLCVVHSVSLPTVGLIAPWNSEDFWGLQFWTFFAYNPLIFNIFLVFTPIKFISSPFPSGSLSKVKSSSFTFLSLYLWSAISVMPYVMNSSLGLLPNPICASPNSILKLLVFLGLRCY